MKTYKYLLAAAIAAVGLASAASASACEAHHPANGTEQTALDVKSAPSDLLGALGEHGLQTLRVDLETVEAADKLEHGPSYNQHPPAKE